MRTALLCLLLVSAQQTSIPTFEVATVKPSDPEKCCSRTFSREQRHFATTNTNLKYLIQWAYNLQAKQVVSGPAWLDQDRFDLNGQIDGDREPTDREWKIAVQNLLADRFQLHFHHSSVELPAYALEIAKGGSKLVPSDPSTHPLQRMGFSGGVGQTMTGYGVNASMADFIGELQRIVLDRPLVDHTGLTGAYSFQLSFTREAPESLGTTALPDTAAPSLLTAIQQQLGLKIVPTKAPVDVIVIDQAEKPSAN